MFHSFVIATEWQQVLYSDLKDGAFAALIMVGGIAVWLSKTIGADVRSLGSRLVKTLEQQGADLHNITQIVQANADKLGSDQSRSSKD
jgi:hypothetical protein